MVEMPAELVARARLLAQGGDWTPPAAVPAATVVLLRDGPADLEVLLMRRPDSMAFAPGMHVFPGGRVDPGQDGSAPVRGSLPSGDWADGPLARALVAAGVRETFEEAGVLIAVDRTGRTVLPDDDWARDRVECEVGAGLPAVLRRRRLHLEADLLVPIAHWITPEVESKRFDTRFLVAELPAGQRVDAHATETDAAVWASPVEALAAHAAGRMPMLPPTVAVLAALAGHRSAGDALAWARHHTVVPLLPRPRVVGDTVEWLLVHGYSGQVLGPTAQPAGSEERGTR